MPEPCGHKAIRLSIFILFDSVFEHNPSLKNNLAHCLLDWSLPTIIKLSNLFLIGKPKNSDLLFKTAPQIPTMRADFPTFGSAEIKFQLWYIKISPQTIASSVISISKSEVTGSLIPNFVP